MREYQCKDCGVTAQTKAVKGFLPYRCVPCRKKIRNASSRAYYHELKRKASGYLNGF